MALIKCPECGREGVSDSAMACPGCGFIINQSNYNSVKQSNNGQKNLAPLIIILVIGGLLFIRMITVFAFNTRDKNKVISLAGKSADEFVDAIENNDSDVYNTGDFGAYLEDLEIDGYIDIIYSNSIEGINEKLDDVDNRIKIYEEPNWLMGSNYYCIDVKALEDRLIEKTHIDIWSFIKIGFYIMFLLVFAFFFVDVFALNHNDANTFIVTNLCFAIVAVSDIFVTSKVLQYESNDSILTKRYAKAVGLPYPSNSIIIIGICLIFLVVVSFIAISVFTKKVIVKKNEFPSDTIYDHKTNVRIANEMEKQLKHVNAKEIKCPKCSSLIEFDDAFCSNCGQKVR